MREIFLDTKTIRIYDVQKVLLGDKMQIPERNHSQVKEKTERPFLNNRTNIELQIVRNAETINHIQSNEQPEPLVHQEIAEELDNQYKDFSNRLQPIRVKSSEHTHGKIFKTKHRTYQVLEKQEYRNSVTEVCPCCVGVLDLDEAASLGKLSSLKDKHSTIHEINPVPSGPLEWISSVIGGYFGLAGLYFGLVNFRGSLDRNAKLKIIHQKNDKTLQKVLHDPKSTNEEIKNLQSYKSSIEYSCFDGQYQKWGDGAMPASGSALMLGSLVYSPLTAPALGIMTGYALGHALKSGYDLHRHSKADISQLNRIEDSMAKKGRQPFLERYHKKKIFYKKVISSYLSYAAGTAILGTAAIAGIASFAFPPALIAVGAVLLLTGVVSTVYFNNRWGKTYAPKNENHIHRQMSGDDESILRRLFLLKQQKNLLKTYKKDLQSKLFQFERTKVFKAKTNTALYYTLTGLTLGVPHKVRAMKKKIKEQFSEDIQSDSVEKMTRDRRHAYFQDMLKLQIEYLEYIKLKIFQMDLSVMKPFIENSKEIPLQLLRKHFVESINQEIKVKKEIHRRMQEVSNLCNASYDFINTWDYLSKQGIIGSVLEKFYDSLEEQNTTSLFENAGFLQVVQKEQKSESHKHKHKHSHVHHHVHNGTLDNQNKNPDEESCGESCGGKHNEVQIVREYSLNLQQILDAVNQNRPISREFLKHWTKAIDYTILNTYAEEMNYQIHELCNHLEDRLRHNDNKT